MNRTLKKILIIYYDSFPPVAEDLSAAFTKLGVQTQTFYSANYKHWFYQHIIRAVNRHARNFRLVKKGHDLFKTHPLNLANYASSNLEKVFSQFQPDAVLVIHGQPFGEDFLSKVSVPKIGWHLEPRDDLPYLIQNATSFDIYNSFSQHDVDLLLGAGFDARYLSHAVDPQNFYAVPDVPKKYDVVFVGHWSPSRDEAIQAAFAVTPNIALYGGYWKKSSMPGKMFKQIYKGKQIVGADLNHLISSARIVLNTSRIPGSYGLNMRFFEVLASGSVLLTDSVPELEQHFVPNTHLVVYQNMNELKERLGELLNDQNKRAVISKNGQQLVLEHHQYDSMAKHLLNQFQEILARKAAA
jgi:glycosyltransferase involved in cell wall biosynthesis